MKYLLWFLIIIAVVPSVFGTPPKIPELPGEVSLSFVKLPSLGELQEVTLSYTARKESRIAETQIRYEGFKVVGHNLSLNGTVLAGQTIQDSTTILSNSTFNHIGVGVYGDGRTNIERYVFLFEDGSRVYDERPQNPWETSCLHGGQVFSEEMDIDSYLEFTAPLKNEEPTGIVITFKANKDYNNLHLSISLPSEGFEIITAEMNMDEEVSVYEDSNCPHSIGWQGSMKAGDTKNLRIGVVPKQPGWGYVNFNFYEESRGLEEEFLVVVDNEYTMHVPLCETEECKEFTRTIKEQNTPLNRFFRWMGNLFRSLR